MFYCFMHSQNNIFDYCQSKYLESGFLAGPNDSQPWQELRSYGFRLCSYHWLLQAAAPKHRGNERQAAFRHDVTHMT